MTVRDIIPLIDKEDAFALVDQNGKVELVHPRDMGEKLSPIMNKPVTQITRYKMDAYSEESYVAYRVAYDREVIE